MKPESWSQAFILAFGFIAGVSTTAYLVLSDPEIRMMFRAKSARIQEGHWSGIAKEVARHTVMELRESFPEHFREILRGD